MGLFETLFSSSTGDFIPQAQQPDQHEIFPDEKYDVAYAVAARREELRALEQLPESDQSSPTALEAEPFLRDIIEDMERDREYSLRLRTSGEALVGDIRELLEHWDRQVDGQIGTIWWPIGADTSFRLYLHYLEARTESEDDVKRPLCLCLYFDLDTSGSAFYLAAWQDDDPEVIQDRLGRISSTAQEIIGAIDEG